MRILFLSQLLPLPLDAGPKIRAYYVLRYLAEAGHDVTLVCFVRPGDRDADVQALEKFCTSVETVSLSRSRLKDVRDGLMSLVSDVPFLIRRDRSPAMDECLARLIGRRSIDALHADQLWMAPFAARHPDVPMRVLDQHNAVFRVPERLAEHQPNAALRAILRAEASKLASFEQRTMTLFDPVVWVSDDDRRAFPVSAGRNGSHHTIPIAVDPGERVPLKRPRPFRVTFLGGLHWPPNAEGVRWFADGVWPRVAEAVPDCVFTVIGKGSVARLGRHDLRHRIDVTGYVADVERYLEETAAFVVPLRTGAGMRVKILDAWCWALPVVSTTIGAEGISAKPGEHLLIGDDEETFADHLIRILQDAPLARRLADSGRATVENLYNWREVYRAWDRVYH